MSPTYTEPVMSLLGDIFQASGFFILSIMSVVLILTVVGKIVKEVLDEIKKR